MGLIHHVSKSIDEWESLEGHSLYASSLPVHDTCFLFDIRYQQDMAFRRSLHVLRLPYPLYYPDRLTDQLALSPSMDTNYDYDLH